MSAQDLHVSTATFTDIGLSNNPPIPGPNDVYQTNNFGAHSTNNGLFNYEDNGFAATALPTGDAGATFIVGSNPGGYVVTNFMFQLFPSGGAFNGSYNPAASGGASEPNNTMQPWTVNFYQVGFDPSGLGSNLTLLSSITTMPGTMTNYGDWVSISNIEVYLAPNTTNAWTISMTPGGYGYCSLPLVSNVATAGTTPIVPGVHPIIALSPTVAQGGVNPPVTYGTSTTNQIFGVWMTNLNPIFSIGLASTFQPSIITTNPFSFMMFSNNLINLGVTWTFTASGTGSTNAGHGLGGYWMANYGSGYTKTLTSDAQPPNTTVIPASSGGAGATVISSLQVINISAGDLGSYVFVVTNSANGSTINSATSQVATLTAINPPTNSYAAAVVNLGAVAYWPLNEMVDPSTEHALAYDLIGGHTGWYGMNADTGVGNAGQGYVPVSGPTSPAFVGFPATNGALGGLRGTNLAQPSGSATNGYEYVCVSNAPSFTALNPTITIAGWVWPNYNTAGKEPGGNAGIFLQRSGQFGATATSGIQVGNNNNNVGYHWDNDNSVTYNFNSGPVMPGYTWSLIALVVQQSNATLYCCSPSIGVQQVVAAGAGTNHVNEAFGNGIEIGLDMNTSPGRTWLGLLSSWAMFPTALTVTNIEQLYDAGVQGGTQTPVMAVDLTNNIEILTGVSANVSFTAAAYGFSPTNGGTWQIAKSAGNWTSLTGSGANGNLGGTAVATSGLSGLLSTTLTVSNASSLDVGSYRIIITNLWGNSVTSQVATISFLAAPAAGSFAATAISPAFGAVAFWPLNEVGDASTGTLEAFDVVGAFNGFYGTNSQTGGTNSFIKANDPLYNFSPVAGPESPGETGFAASQGALGSVQNVAALPNTYVSIAASPTFSTSGPNTTNVTMVAWLYPNTFTEGAQTGIAVMRGSTQNAGLYYGAGTPNNCLGWTWDGGGSSTTYNYNSALYIPSNMWSMVALVVTPSNGVFYVCNTNLGIITTNQTIANVNQPWGQQMTIGTDTYSVPGRNFGGAIADLVMFSNSLSYSQIATLFDAGLANSNQLPFFFQNPLNSQLFTNFPVNATFTAAGYGGANNLTNGSYWQRNVSGTWVTLTDGINGGTANISGSCTTNTNSLNLYSTLTVSNVSSADVGSYRLIITNSYDGLNTYAATSGVATLALITTQPAANSFAAAVLATPGVVAYWPLNETGDPSTGAVEAYDLVGGFNGLYGVNAQDGGLNSVLKAAGGPNYFSPVPGPSSVFTGFPANTNSLGSLQNTLANTFVTTLSSPTFPTNGAPGWHTNITIVAWINPQTNEVANTGLVMIRTNGQVDGLCYGPNANALGYNWNNSATFARGQVLATNQWYLVALVITNNSSSLLVAGTNGSLSEVVNMGVANVNQTWGGALTIGGDPVGGGIARSFGGYISSVAIFSNALTAAQVENLYLAGYKDGVVPPPVIAVQPVSTNMMLTPGISASITASAFGFPPINGYFQKWSGTAWANVANAGDISGATSLFPALTLQQGTLVFSAIGSADAGSYQMVVTNMTGSVTSQVVSVSLIAAPAAGTFASAITNAAYGTVAYWPLKETVDPSSGLAVAFDVVGGYNGVYGVNAQDGAINQALKAAGGANYLGAVAGPGAAGLTGLPSSGALASLQNALPNTFVTTAYTPSLPGLNSASSFAVPNSTNMTLVEWIYPLTNGTAGTGLFFQRGGTLGASRTDGLYLNSGPILSGAWDNNAVSGFAGPAIPLSNWSMVAIVVTPASNIYYVGTNFMGTNVLISSTQTAANVNEPFGGGVAIGGDPGNPNNGTNVDAVSFGGYISSVAMFTNSLTVQQMETLFVAGESDGVVTAPVIITQPAISTFELIQGGSLTLTAAGYGAQAGGYWTFNGNPVNTPDITGTNVTLVGTLLTGKLQITNFQAADVGSYQMVLTNSAGSAASSTVAISIFMAAPGSFPVTATKTPGVIALWPLNETGDPSTGTQLAYDIVGGFNGVYGVTAQDGGVNSGLTAALAGAGLPAGDNRGAVAGPSTAGLVGLPATAFGSINNLANCLVTVAQGPSLSGINSTNGVAGPVTTATPNSTNMTIVLWYQPLPILTATAGTYANYPNTYDILFMECNGFLNAIGENGCQLDDSTTATPGNPGYDWDNNSSSTYGYTTGVPASFNTWYFYALQISPSNGVVWQGSMQTGLLSTTNAYANVNIPWGGGLQIGGCAAGYPSSAPADAGYANYFNGNISCATMFSNTLNVGQIVNLFASGISGGTAMAPLITTQPSAAVEVISGGTVHLSSTAYVGTNVAGAYWQVLTNGNWVNLANLTNVISGATNGVTSGYNEVASLSIVLSPATAGSYRVIFTNGVGTGTISGASTLSAYTAQPGGFAATATTIPGLVALWPLNEQVDPSTGTAIAFDVIGGYNGTYGTNAQDGTNNAQLAAVISGAGLPSSDYVSPVQGPGSAGLTGLPVTAFAPITGLAGSVITVPVGPAVPAGNTNMSIILWINDSGQTENGGGNYTDLLEEINGFMGAGGNNGAQLNLNAGAAGTLQMAYDWDNDNNSAHGWVTGAYVPISVWSMYALVISPSNAVLYLVNSNGFTALTNNFANIYIPWGAGLQIGGCQAGSGGANNFFTGSISSAAMYTNTLNIQQISTLYAAGSALGNPPPEITANPPFTNYVLLTNGSATITALAYAGPNGGGYWQMYSSGSGTWTNLVAGGDHPSVSASVPAGSAMTVGTLVLTNVTGNDVGSYRCIFTNATSISVTSAPVVLQPLLSNPPANSFEAIAISPSFGMVAYWPLNDNGSVTTNTVTYDVWGGWNGIYGTNASDGLYNIEIGAGTAGPGSAGLLGFPSGDFSLGCNNQGINGYVKTAASPTMANTTNMTIVVWIQPTNGTMPTNTALVVTRTSSTADGLAYGTGNSLESLWNGAYGDIGSGCQPSVNAWSMAAMVVTSSSTTFYACTTNGVSAFPFVGANVYQSWGSSLAIGGDPGTDPGDTFQGFMADVAIFSNALSSAQLANLYYAGVASGAVPPTISTQPVGTEVYAGRPAEFTVVYSGFGNVTNQWQYKSGGTWINVVNGPGITGATNANLVIKNSSSAPGTSYRVIVGNSAGTVISGTVTLAAAPPIGTYTYPQAVTNLNPVSYYRFNEPAGSLSAYDYWGGLTGTYGNYPDPVISGQTDLAVSAGVPGVNNTMNGRLIDFSKAPGAFENNNTAAQFTNGLIESGVNSQTALNSFVTIPPLTTLSNGVITNNMTITMWIWPNEAQTDNAGLLYCRQGGTIAGVGFASAGNSWLGYNWGNNPATVNWTGNANLVPTVGAWNFVALVITPTNATEYCYSKASQQVAVNTATNAAQAWAGAAEIGNDPYDVTGARQFDGSIDEVAIFNQSLSSAQVNQLWLTATGIPVPAQIVSAPVGQTNFMNLGANVSYTVNAVNGPLTYWWVLTNSQFHSQITLTNGANGFAGTVFSGATTGTLNISNWPAAFNINDTLIVNVTNTASPVIATTNWGIPALLPTYAVWTAGFAFTNGGNWAAGGATLRPNGYTNFGVVGLGTFWNPLISGGNVNETATAWAADTFTNQTAWDCTETIQTGLFVSCNGQPYCDGNAVQQNALLQTFLQSFSGTVFGDTTVPGFYNFIFYTSSGSFGLSGTMSYGIHNYTNTDTDVGTYTSFVQGGNFMIMTNIYLNAGLWTFTQSYTGEGFDAGGLQIQLIQPIVPLTFTNVGNTTTLYWSGGTLQSATNVLGPFTSVLSNGNFVTSPYVLPKVTGNSAIFYNTPVITNTAAPGIPIN